MKDVFGQPFKERGKSSVLLQSGLNESWWADSMECYTYLRNVYRFII